VTLPLPAVTPKSGAKVLLFSLTLTILYIQVLSFNYFYVPGGILRAWRRVQKTLPEGTKVDAHRRRLRFIL
jgi:hypothetical protein